MSFLNAIFTINPSRGSRVSHSEFSRDRTRSKRVPSSKSSSGARQFWKMANHALLEYDGLVRVELVLGVNQKVRKAPMPTCSAATTALLHPITNAHSSSSSLGFWTCESCWGTDYRNMISCSYFS